MKHADMPMVTSPCWFLVNTLTGHGHEDGDVIPHYSTKDKADDAAKGAIFLAVCQVDYLCVLGPSCLDCGATFEDWMDGGHHMNPDEAVMFVGQCDWRQTPKGWLCGNHVTSTGDGAA